MRPVVGPCSTCKQHHAVSWYHLRRSCSPRSATDLLLSVVWRATWCAVVLALVAAAVRWLAS